MTGGCSRRQAIEIIAERDCGHLGTAIEIVDIDDLPADRTYRMAWRRSQNGGEVWLDENIVQQIDEMRSWKEYESLKGTPITPIVYSSDRGFGDAEPSRYFSLP